MGLCSVPFRSASRDFSSLLAFLSVFLLTHFPHVILLYPISPPLRNLTEAWCDLEIFDNLKKLGSQGFKKKKKTQLKCVPLISPLLATWIGLLAVGAGAIVQIASQIIERIRTFESHRNVCSRWRLSWAHSHFSLLILICSALFRHLAGISIPLLFHSVLVPTESEIAGKWQSRPLETSSFSKALWFQINHRSRGYKGTAC